MSGWRPSPLDPWQAVSVINLLAVDPSLVSSAYGVEILVARHALVSILLCVAGTRSLLGGLGGGSCLTIGTCFRLLAQLGYVLGGLPGAAIRSSQKYSIGSMASPPAPPAPRISSIRWLKYPYFGIHKEIPLP